MASDFTFDDILALGQEAQTAIYERGNLYGTVGIAGANGVFTIPTAEKGKRLVTVTVEDGTLIKADTDGMTPLASAKVRLRREAGQFVIKGSDSRAIDASDTNNSASIAKHNHNIGNPLFTPIDPASVADGLILPTGNGLQVTIGRVSYPKTDGNLGIYESEDVLDLASAISGLTANQSRWVVHYILRTDGTATFFSATAVTGTLNYTTHIESAVAECLTSEPDAYPYAVTKIRAGITTFGTYKAMQGRSPDGKDMVRLGIAGAIGGGSSGSGDLPEPITGTFTIASGYSRTESNVQIASGGELIINGSLYIL